MKPQKPIDGLIQVTYTKGPMLNHLLLAQALNYYGEREIPGAKSNPFINTMLRSVGLPARDSIAWCSAFVNLVATEVGAERTNNALARSWVAVGRDTLPQHVRPGMVVVLRRGNSKWQGHVGFVVRINRKRGIVWVLGGNQSNRVCIKAYPTNRVLSYRTLGYHKRKVG